MTTGTGPVARRTMEYFIAQRDLFLGRTWGNWERCALMARIRMDAFGRQRRTAGLSIRLYCGCRGKPGFVGTLIRDAPDPAMRIIRHIQ